MRGPKVRRQALATFVVLVALLCGCGAEEGPGPATDATATPTSSSTPVPSSSELPTPATVRVPEDGVTLAQFGFSNGPVAAFSLPRSTVITNAVDQTNGITVVLSNPSAAEVANYLRRALPATGFVITQDDPGTTTMTFTGYGWHGSFTGSGPSSAVILRP